MPVTLPPKASSQYLVQALDQVHPSFQEVIVRQVLLCPASQNPVQSLTFGSTELIVAQIGVMNDLRYPPYPAVADRELFGQSLEGTILASMTEPLRAEHVKRDSVRVHAWLGTEDESCLGVNEAANQPSR